MLVLIDLTPRSAHPDDPSCNRESAPDRSTDAGRTRPLRALAVGFVRPPDPQSAEGTAGPRSAPGRATQRPWTSGGPRIWRRCPDQLHRAQRRGARTTSSVPPQSRVARALVRSPKRGILGGAFARTGQRAGGPGESHSPEVCRRAQYGLRPPARSRRGSHRLICSGAGSQGARCRARRA